MTTIKIATFACIAALGLIAGCSSTKSSNMGATSGKEQCTDKAACCKDKAGSMGAVNAADKPACCADKAKAGSMGAVSTEKKEGCCSAEKK